MNNRLSVLIIVTLLVWPTVALKADLQASSPGSVQRLNEVWMVTFIADGGVETVAQGQLTTGAYVPMIAADRERMESMLPAAQDMAKARNIRMRLIKFTTRVDLQEILP